jgi:hypothetical protein
MSLIYTTKGLINREDLVVLDNVQEDEKARYVQTQWFLGDELVRQDAWVNMKTGIDMSGEANLG